MKPAGKLALTIVATLLATAISRGADVPVSIEADFLTNPRQVTHDFIKAGEGYFSPDAKDIIYQAVSKDYLFYQIFTQPLAGGIPRRVSPGRGRTTCSYFAPDGAHILFASSHLDPQIAETEDRTRQQEEDDRKAGRHRRYEWIFDPWMDIFEADRDGQNLHRLTNEPGYDAEGAYSPDGKLIAFCSDRDGDPDIYLMNADGTHVRQLTNTPGYDGGPFISPDGQWVVFRSDRKKEGYLQIYVIGLDGKHEMPLTDNAGVNWAPFWHPHEPYIIWTGADHSKPDVRPNYDLWLMRYRATSDQVVSEQVWRVTDHAGADVLPVFSPEGQHLMWTTTRGADHTSQLWYADFRLPQ